MSGHLTRVLRTGATMPTIGLGTWKAEKGLVGAAVKVALEAGYRHIDCAAVYQNEAEIGEQLKQVFAAGTVQRKDVFFTSKLWNTEHAPEHVKPALQKTLKDLQLEYLDLYLIHWPMSFVHNEEGDLWPSGPDGKVIDNPVPHVDTWKALEACVDEGLVKHIGLSNFNQTQIQNILDNSRIKPAVLQVEVHPFVAQKSLIKFCQDNGIVVTGYCPLGSGVTGLLSHPTVTALANKYNKKESQVLIRYAVDKGIVSIPKSTNADRIALNLDVEGFALTSEDIDQLDGLHNGHRVCGVPQWAHLEGYGWPDEVETLKGFQKQ